MGLCCSESWNLFLNIIFIFKNLDTQNKNTNKYKISGKRQSVDITTSKPQTKNGISSVAGPPDDFAAPPSETDHKNFST